MKKRIYMITAILIVGFLGGCGKETTESNEPAESNEQVESNEPAESNELAEGNNPGIEEESVQAEEHSDSVSREKEDIELNNELEIDFTYDYSKDIKADVECVIADSESLQTELENIEMIIQKYTPLAKTAQSQAEMNLSSGWFLEIWDTELNALWSRFSDSADQQTKEKLLEEQRNWIAMKEEVILLSIGSREENGSMYPLLRNSFLEEITENRAYVLANELAKIKGESFVMPKKSEKYGLFVDNQGTGSIYSFLNSRQGWEGDDEAIISIYGRGEIEGIFVDNGNGELIFTSDDGSVEGIIKIGGWDGASFIVTGTSGESVFAVGEEFIFPFVF